MSCDLCLCEGDVEVHEDWQQRHAGQLLSVGQAVEPTEHVWGAGLLQAALQWQGQEVDQDEVECLVANLIARSLIKGYISHNMRTAVLSKVDAFPAAGDHPPLGAL